MNLSHKNICFILLLLSTIGNGAFATVTEQQNKGREIIKKLLSQDDGFTDLRADVHMTIHEKNGSQFMRHMQAKILEQKEDGEKRLFTFDQPRDISGTSILSYTLQGKDSQWIYLPAFRRVKRIATTNKASPFVSSEFSYEDIAAVELIKYQYLYIKDQSIDGTPCYVIKMTPLFDGSGYSHQVVYVDHQEHLFRKIEFYDKKKQLMKTLKLQNYKKHINQYWLPLKLMMVNHQNGRTTQMLWQDVVYKNGFRDTDFSLNALKRSR